MRELFEIAELVRIGVEDEASGLAFYSHMAQKARSPELQKVFRELAEQEKYHHKRFSEMLESLGGFTPREQYSGEYIDYLRTLVGGRAFPDEKAAMQRAEECRTDAEAIDMASQFERDTLILMNELKGLVPPGDQAVVNEMIREERSHLVALADARRLI